MELHSACQVSAAALERWLRALALACALGAATSVYAHHSAALFDTTKPGLSTDV